MSVAQTNTIPEAELPALFRQPTGNLVPGTKEYYAHRFKSLETYVPMAVSLDALPSHLSNRNHPNTRYVPPVIFFGFEVSGMDQFWEVIFPNIGGVVRQIVYGLNGNAVQIAVIGNNVEPFLPCSQEGIEKVAQALGQPPKLYVSAEYWWWGRRSHYHYSW